ncbi:flavin-dependent oxidoreductase [Hoeflea sp. YIM 152468]|uniref:flavin-dependent oxidoreductase n=1 Tax=Hoeflea sp. YIM 152468 TaxID=3031759 RepID=UPI0023DB3923|nr:flavin-dependent oxidoreductase [Hoeflea sp. YIM 152468]MDF1608095.1 flavin-dependent oxidoreductase [Hoeflea sp. YIM 152468]
MTLLVAGAGIAGLTFALTCHQIGLRVKLFEQVDEIRPLGVGINLQPHAIRELTELGLEGELEAIGIRTREVAYFSKHGRPIWSEARGLEAGYDWPQWSVHRGKLQLMLMQAVRARLGPGAIETGWKATGYSQDAEGPTLHLENRKGQTRTERGHVLVAADGIHSAIRAQMNPEEGSPIWGGAVLWRATSRAKPFLTGATMAMVGHEWQKFVTYPISEADPGSGLADINWVAEIKKAPDAAWNREDWNRPGDVADFLPAFKNWKFDWLDIPALIGTAEQIYEYPMVDRNPLDSWTDGAVTLMGDAAHPMYPIGSNGASQAILDARILGRNLVRSGLSPAALIAYEDERRPATSKIVVANRGNGPDQIMQVVEDKCQGMFDAITDIMSAEDLADHAARYKALAGFDLQTLNARPPLISQNDRVGGGIGNAAHV